MTAREVLVEQVTAAAREQGMVSVLLRNAVSRKLGLNVTDMECLSLLTINGISTPKELARYTGLTPSSTTAMLDRLESAKLIKRAPNLNDRRGVLIQIDKRSAGRLASVFAEGQTAQSKLINSYSDSELETIADFLTRFTDNVKAQTKIIETNLR